MPNWCSNHIKIEGPKDKVEAIWSKATDDSEDGLLGALHPIGEWDYHTAIDQWGTKWDVNMTDANLEISEDGTTIEGYFESAWSPPILAIDNYLENNDDVTIHCKYYEPANDFIGSNYYGDFSVYGETRTFWELDSVGKDLDETFYVTEMLDEHNDEIEEEHLDGDTLVDPEKLPNG